MHIRENDSLKALGAGQPHSRRPQEGACEDPAVKQQTAFLKRVAGTKIPTLSLH